MGARWEGRCPSCSAQGQYHHAWCVKAPDRVPTGTAEAARAESLSLAQGIIACLVVWALFLGAIAVVTIVAAYHPSLDSAWVVSLLLLAAYLIAGWVQ